MPRNTHSGRQEGEKGGVVAFAHTVVHPLAVVIAAFYTVITLDSTNQQ